MPNLEPLEAPRGTKSFILTTSHPIPSTMEQSSKMHDHPISFTSTGLVILDEIRFPNREPLTNVLGGSGTYATLGARLFLPGNDSRTLGWMIHTGNDFPESTEQRLRSWNASLTIHKDVDEPSTRGLLEYKDTTFGPKNFRYTTPHLSINEKSLANTPILASQSFHYLTTPEDLETRISTLLSLRQKAGITQRPLIVWEPAPLASNPENLSTCLKAAHSVDVFSQNHFEIASLFSVSPSQASEKNTIEHLAQKVLSSGVGPEGKGVVIIRAGEHGSLITARHLAPTWVPPFYSSEQRADRDGKIVDPTGAGNAFLGAYAVGFLKTEGDIVLAACYGSVGASFALEQVGMPEMRKGMTGEGELWNGVSVYVRLEEFLARGVVQTKVVDGSET